MTSRRGGASQPPFDSLNLGDHVHDDPQRVHANRQRLAEALGAQPVFMRQVHGTACVNLGLQTPNDIEADACVTQRPGLACTVMVADCLPVLVCDRAGRTVGAAHAGWRGLASGVLSSFIQNFQAISLDGNEIDAIDSGFSQPLMAWLGPCIGAEAFEVGPEVRQAFLVNGIDAVATDACFKALAHKPGFYCCDLAGLARLQLRGLGVTQVYGNDSTARWCTVAQPSEWFSHRRDAVRFGGTGRMAACVWRS